MSSSPQDVSHAVAELMPNVIRGIQLDFFIRKRVTQTQFLVLVAIHAAGRTTMGPLARNLHVRMPTATGIVHRLVLAGYVRRHTGPDDRRCVWVELTPKGHAFIREFQGIIQRRWEEVLRSLPPRELAAFHGVIVTLQDQLRRADT